MEVAARLAKREAAEKTGLSPEKIGAVSSSPPVPAKVTASKMPLGTGKSQVSAVVAISEVYPKLLHCMKQVKEPKELSSAGKIGVNWGSSTGEASALLNDNYLAADGIENVIKVLEDLEDEKFGNLDFIELNACNAGCVGGVLTVENPYIARTKLKRLRKYLPVSLNHVDQIPPEARWDVPLEYAPVLKLDPDMGRALSKLEQMEEIERSLPGLDCGSCGAPSCKALAEDVVRGSASPDDCIFKFKENMTSLFSELHRLEGLIPPSYLKNSAGGEKEDSDDAD